MGAPVAVARALATTRTGRRIVIGVLALLALAIALVMTPLIAVPFALAGQASTTSIAEQGAPATNGEWGYPLAGDYFTGRGYGYHPVNGCSYCSSNHRGYDMSQDCWDPIYAAGPGRVVHAGALSTWGNTVRIDHGNNLFTLYGHMPWGGITVAVGDEVTAGTQIGSQGETGMSYGCHLHFEVQEGWKAIPPEPFMAALGLPLK